MATSTPRASRGRRDPDRKRRLLDIGLTLFGSISYADVSIDTIAERAGISKGLLYHYFGGKRAFYQAVVQHAAEALLRELVPDRSQPPLVQLRTSLEAYLAFVDARGPAYEALVTGGLGTDEGVQGVVDRARSVIAAMLLANLVRDFRREPEDVAFAEIAIRAWLGALERGAVHWLRQAGDPNRAPAARMVTLFEASLDACVTSAGLPPLRSLGAAGDVASSSSTLSPTELDDEAS